MVDGVNPADLIPAEAVYLTDGKRLVEVLLHEEDGDVRVHDCRDADGATFFLIQRSEMKKWKPVIPAREAVDGTA
jgi:hypothetical protein